jgi:hypothetical protein
VGDLTVGRIEQLSNDARTPEWKETAGNISVPRQDATGDLCASCLQRPATMNWTGEGGTLAFVHGMYQRWCELCVVSAQVAYALKSQDGLPALKARLAELRAEPPTTNAVDPVDGVTTE